VLRRSVPFLILFSGCLGPPAPDADLCVDLVTRLCLSPICPDALRVLNVTEGSCVQTLSTRTGCTQASFTFNTPSRQRFLDCRAPLVKTTGLRTANPACEDVSTMLNDCPDLVSFLNGG
jgi:hypothetical protein